MLSIIIICVGWFAGLSLKQPPPKPHQAKQPPAHPNESHTLLPFPVVMHFNKTTAERSVRHPFRGPSDPSSGRGNRPLIITFPLARGFGQVKWPWLLASGELDARASFVSVAQQEARTHTPFTL